MTGWRRSPLAAVKDLSIQQTTQRPVGLRVVQDTDQPQQLRSLYE